MPQKPNPSAYPPEPGDREMRRGGFFIDFVSLRPVPNTPGYFTLYAEGNLPTPCHLPRVAVEPPDLDHRIAIQVYSVVPKGQMCIQVLKPFSGVLAELGGYPSGNYTVKVNDLPDQEIDVP